MLSAAGLKGRAGNNEITLAIQKTAGLKRRAGHEERAKLIDIKCRFQEIRFVATSHVNPPPHGAGVVGIEWPTTGRTWPCRWQHCHLVPLPPRPTTTSHANEVAEELRAALRQGLEAMEPELPGGTLRKALFLLAAGGLTACPFPEETDAAVPESTSVPGV